MAMDNLALDRASTRTIDADGRLRVTLTNISKANVCPYKGSEIPDYQRLGLQADRIYQLYRDPDELARAASTFNQVPLLDTHVVVNAADPKQERVVGSTGTDTVFVAPYLKTSLVIWDARAIAGVESGEQKELSSAYRYRADMTPGECDGVRYDGVMRDIVGNHVALVEAGRAGPDVVVGDSQEKKRMTAANTARVDAVIARIKPFLAQDADLEKVREAIAEPKGEDKGRWTPEGYEAGGVFHPIRNSSGYSKKRAGDSDPMMEDDQKDRAKGEDDEREDESDEDKRKREAADKRARDKKARDKARDADPDDKDQEGAEEDDKKEDKAAMDAAIAQAKRDTEASVIARLNAARQAERDVRPFVGDVFGMDSAEAIYKFALDKIGVDTKGVHPSAYPALLKLAPVPGSQPRARMALDAAGAKSFNERFPHAARIKQV